MKKMFPVNTQNERNTRFKEKFEVAQARTERYRPDVEIMVYLGILDTRKVLGSQKILTKITAILSRK